MHQHNAATAASVRAIPTSARLTVTCRADYEVTRSTFRRGNSNVRDIADRQSGEQVWHADRWRARADRLHRSDAVGSLGMRGVDATGVDHLAFYSKRIRASRLGVCETRNGLLHE